MTWNAMTFDTTFTHHMARVNGVRLHYVIGGTGDPVVLLHGWAQTWYEWRHVMPALAERYTVIAPDMRGLGDSSKPLSGYDKRTVASDIYELVRQLTEERIFLVGHDLGGAVAYAYTAAERDNVRRLAIVEMTIPGFGLEESMQVSPDGHYNHITFHMSRDMPEALIMGRERMYLSWFYKNYSYNKTAIAEADIDEYVRCYSAPGGLRAGFEYYRAFFDDAKQNQKYAKEKLKMPVLALGGEFSMGDAPHKSMQKLAENVYGGVAEQCGHWMAEERPDYLTQQLLTFFGQEK